MTAYQLLITELARHGRTTYAALLRRYGHIYEFDHFAHAVRKARKLGIVTPDGGKGKPIVLTAGAVCACCGRKL